MLQEVQILMMVVAPKLKDDWPWIMDVSEQAAAEVLDVGPPEEVPHLLLYYGLKLPELPV